MTEYLEGALSATDIERFEQHLTECNGCGAYLDQIRTTIALTGRLTSESDPARGPRRTLARLPHLERSS